VVCLPRCSLLSLINAVDAGLSTYPCCDSCILKRRGIPDAILTSVEETVLSLVDRIRAKPSPTRDASQGPIDVGGLDVVTGPNISSPRRRGEWLRLCREALAQWRDNTWDQKYSRCAWGPNVLLPKTVITKLASSVSVSTLEDLKREVPDWDFAEVYGLAVIDIIKGSDDLWKREHDQEIQARKENRRRQSEKNKQLRDELQRQQRREDTLRRKADRWLRSFAQHMGPVLAPLPSFPQVSQHDASESLVSRPSSSQPFPYQHYVPQAYVPQAYVPQAFVPQAFVPQYYVPQAFAPQPHALQTFAPPSDPNFSEQVHSQPPTSQSQSTQLHPS